MAPFIITHGLMVQPLIRLELTTVVVFSGEIDSVIEDQALSSTVEVNEVVAQLEELEIGAVV